MAFQLFECSTQFSFFFLIILIRANEVVLSLQQALEELLRLVLKVLQWDFTGFIKILSWLWLLLNQYQVGQIQELCRERTIKKLILTSLFHLFTDDQFLSKSKKIRKSQLQLFKLHFLNQQGNLLFSYRSNQTKFSKSYCILFDQAKSNYIYPHTNRLQFLKYFQSSNLILFIWSNHHFIKQTSTAVLTKFQILWKFILLLKPILTWFFHKMSSLICILLVNWWVKR